MKFTSVKFNKDCVLSMNVILDAELFGTFKREEDGMYTVLYDMSDGGVAEECLFPTTETMFILRLTDNNVFASAIVYVDEDAEPTDIYSPYIVDGMIEFNVRLTDEEKMRLLLAMIKAKA